MDIQKPKCSSNRHKDVDAISYCPQCKKYLCNKFHNFHSEMNDDHQIVNLKEIKEVFIDLCKEPNHNMRLEFYCRTHNVLCCGLCTSKIKEKGKYGQHSDCDICLLKNIKDEKKSQLKDNLDKLNELSNQIEKNINELKLIFERMNKSKEELKAKVQSIFCKLRNALNAKEDKLISEIDEKFDKNYFKEDLIKESEKLPKEIKISSEKGKKIINKKWEENNLSSLINDCLSIENNIKGINKINENVKKSDLNKKIFYNIEEDDINAMINNIQNFSKIANDLYDDFKIEQRKPIHILKDYSSDIYCL